MNNLFLGQRIINYVLVFLFILVFRYFLSTSRDSVAEEVSGVFMVGIAILIATNIFVMLIVDIVTLAKKPRY